VSGDYLAKKTNPISVVRDIKKRRIDMEEQEIGVVDHFFDKISVGMIKLSGELKVGDTIRIKGKQVDFSQEVKSMRIEFDNVTEAKEGDKVGIKVDQPLHTGDKVYR
jgi:translation initiation factor IF-2